MNSARGTWRGGSFTGNSESYVRHVKKALEMSHLTLYTGSMRRTQRDGSYTEDSDRHVIEGSGNKHFIYMAP